MPAETLVRTRRVARDDLAGRLFAGLGDGPHPGVLVVHGSGGGGGYEQAYAALLAEHGYTAFCVEYFDAPGAPDALADVPLSLFDRAIEFLAGRPSVAGGPVGVVGFSRGGEAALLVGARSDRVGPVAAYVPSGYVFPAPTWMDGVDEEGPTWLADGDPVPYVPIDPVVDSDPDGIDDLGSDDPAAGQAVRAASADVLDRATIPVEEIAGPVLLVSGGRDRVWPSADLAAVAAERLAAHDRHHDHRRYPEAGHAIRVPYSGGEDPAAEHPFGGTAGANARAAADAWRATLDLFHRGLPDAAPRS